MIHEVTDLQYTALIGLEIHVQLATRSKMFCGCPNRFGDEPNSNVCPICMGSPGVLPVMNRQAYQYAVRTALALQCEIAPFTKWDRKSYYYPDLPKNYQISQYDLPLSRNGQMEISLPDGSTKKVRIRRAHLEEDAGKNIHDNPTHTGVDLNRAGVPLLEIVSEPDMNSVEEVMAYCRSMQRLVRWLGVSEADMQKGHIRFEPNINLHIVRDGKTCKTPIVEVKNLNSFRSLERTVIYEIKRQLTEWQADPETCSLEKLGKQNRGYDDARGQTIFQREKEEAHDYRYFPDPDLVPVTPEPEWITRMREELPELPRARQKRFAQQYDLSPSETATILEDRATADLFEQAAEAGVPPKVLCNQFISFWAMHANQRNCTIAELGLTSAQLATLATMVSTGVVNATVAATLAERILATGDDPRTIAERENLLQVSDSSALEALVEEVIRENPGALDDASKPGKKQKKAFGFLLGQVMQKSRGQANPKVVNELLLKRISSP